MIGRVAKFCRKVVDWAKADMSMVSYFPQALKITNNNIILATPLILSVIFMSMYLMLTPVNKTFGITFVLILFFAMTAVFLSGWLYSISKAVDNYTGTEVSDVFTKENSDGLGLLKMFPTGVGKHFATFFMMITLFFLLITGVIIFSYKTAYMLIGGIGISRPELFFALSSTEAMKALLASLTMEQQLRLSYWNLYFLMTTTIYSFIIMFWAPEIIYGDHHVLKSLGISIKNLFRRFFKSLGIFIFIMMLYFIISIFSALFRSAFMQFVMTVIYFYFLVYSSVLIFLFYKKEFKGE